jgi:PEP-CTERM motif-containing protein
MLLREANVKEVYRFGQFTPQADHRTFRESNKRISMRKHALIAGILMAAALVFAMPAKADTVTFTLTGGALGGSLTFSLPQTFTPTAGTGSGPFLFANVNAAPNPGNPVFGSAPFTLPNIELGVTATNQWSFGSNGVPGFPGTTGNFLGIFAPGLFTVNADGTITLNDVGTQQLINNADASVTLTEVIIPTPPTGTPEPATLALLGIGGLALTGLRRRKAA